MKLAVTARSVALLAGVVSVAAALGSSDGAQQAPTFRARTDLVQVDVVAVDAQGNAVRGLTAADFTLLDRKKPQTIVTFEEVSRAGPGPAEPQPPAAVRRDVASNQGAMSDRLVVMVIDDLHLLNKRTARVQEIARTFLDDLRPQGTMSVLFTSREHSTEATDDRSTLLRALDTLKGRLIVPRPIRATDNPNGRAGPGLQDFFDDMQIFKTLEDAARALHSGTQRRRAFVYVSEGLGRDFNGMFQGPVTPCDMRCPQCPCYHDRALLDMMRSLQRSNVSVYAIDARGSVPREDFSKECRPAQPNPRNGCDPCRGDCPGQNPERDAWPRLAEFGLEIEAKASGGFAITNTDDYGPGLKRIVADLEHYYLLGFAPEDRGSGYRPLTVTVNRPGVTLRYRNGYDLGGSAAKTSVDPVAALASSPLPDTGLPMRLTAAALPGPAPVATAGKDTSAETRVVMAVEVSVPPAGGTDPLLTAAESLRYSVIAVDLDKHKAVRQFTNTAQLVPQSGGSGTAATTQLPAEFTLPPGHYQLRASALTANAGLGGSVYLEFDVPEFKTGRAAMSSLLLGYADGAHVAVGAGPAGSRADPNAVPIVPSLDRAFTATDTVRIYFEAIPRAATGPPLKPLVELIDAKGAVAASIVPALTAKSNRVACDVKVPLAGLAPGAYTLRASVTEGTAAPLRQEIGLVVHP